LDTQRIRDFLRYDVWRIRLQDLPRSKSFLLRQLRVVILALRGFDEDRCSLRASALTFYSLLSVVPLAAMLFGIAKGFGLQTRLEREVLEQFAGQEEVVGRIITFSKSMLEETSGGLIAGLGVAGLFFLIIRLLGNIEASFNEVWGIPHSRPLLRKLTDYLSVMLIGPVLLILSSSITVFISTQLHVITEKMALLGILSTVVPVILKVLAYCVIWLLFTFIYMFMPNTRVHFRSALWGGIVAGTLYELVQYGYITFQVGAGRYGAIYGSFAALPLFLIWLQLSWLIVLFGAEISFASQNVETYEFEPDALQVKPSFKRLLSLAVVHICVKRFCSGKEPLTAAQISQRMEVPVRLVNQILFELVQARVLSETNGNDEREPAFQPARDVDTLTVSYVIEALEGIGTEDIPVSETAALDRLGESLERLREAVEQSEGNVRLRDIA